MAHGAAMALVDPAVATHAASSSGPWSDPGTWAAGEAPTDGARVTIPDGVTVTVDGVVAPTIATIGIEGTLAFAPDVDTELRVDTIVSGPTGRLEIGTTERPIAPEVTTRIVFADRGPIDVATDPEQLGRGAILHGTTIVYGAETLHRTVVAAPATAGATEIQLAGELTGWHVGDQIVITGTQGPTSDETRTITAVDGGIVSLDRPLELDHVPPRADLDVYVANLTRNVVFESENPEIGRRGHVMFMHTQAVDVNHVRFDHLGRTDKSRPLDDLDFGETAGEGGNSHDGTMIIGPRTNIRARYSVHFHRTGTDPTTVPGRVAGSVVYDDPGWGFVNHSSNADFVDNVSWGAKGVGFMTEAGDEVGSMVGNIAIRSVMPGFAPEDEGAIDPDTRSEQQDFGFQGDGFWFQGNRVRVADNVSAGASAHGFIFWSEGLIENTPDPAVPSNSMVDVATLPDPSLVPDREQIEVWWAPLEPVTDNVSYSATIGFRSRYVHGGHYLGDTNPPPQEYIDSLDPVIDGLTVWGSRDGVLLNYNERLSLVNADIVGIGAPFRHNLFATAAVGVGLDLQNEVTRGPGRLENIRIEGFEMGLLAPRNDGWTVRDLRLANTTDVLIHEPRHAPRTLDMSSIEFASLDGTAVAGSESARRNVVMDPHFDADEDQPQFFLIPDRISLDGQGIYFDEQAAGFVPTPTDRPDDDDGFDEEEFDEAEFDEEEFDEDGFDEEEFDDDGFDDDDRLEGDESAEDLELDVDVSIGPYVGLTNADLDARFGLSFGGALLPVDASNAAWLIGGVTGTPAPAPTAYPELVEVFNVG